MRTRTDRYQLADTAVWRVGYGAMQLAGAGVLGPPDDHDEAIAVLREAVEAGVDYIDTSHYYGLAVVNELIREALSPYPDNLALVSKVGGRRDEVGAFLPYNDPDQLRIGIEDNLRTLDIERLTAVNLRLLDDARWTKRIGFRSLCSTNAAPAESLSFRFARSAGRDANTERFAPTRLSPRSPPVKMPHPRRSRWHGCSRSPTTCC